MTHKQTVHALISQWAAASDRDYDEQGPEPYRPPSTIEPYPRSCLRCSSGPFWRQQYSRHEAQCTGVK